MEMYTRVTGWMAGCKVKGNMKLSLDCSKVLFIETRNMDLVLRYSLTLQYTQENGKKVFPRARVN